MICPTCGSQIPDGIKFCPVCGSSLQETAPASQPASQPSYGEYFSPVNPEPASSAYPQPEYQSPVNNDAYQQTPAYNDVYQQTPAYNDVYQQPSAYNDVYQVPVSAPVRNDAGSDGEAKSIMILGIIGIVLSNIPYFISIGGIIVSAICRGKVKNYMARYGAPTGKAKVGAILSKIGLILGIIMTVCMLILLICAIALGWEDFWEVIFDLY